MKAKTGHSGLSGIVSLESSRSSKRNESASGLVGIVSLDAAPIEQTVAISGSELLVRRAGELYAQGAEQDARVAMREALKIAMQRLDANHGPSDDEPQRTKIGLQVAWNS